jgi:sugar-specific transcriptional regulator TrmB
LEKLKTASHEQLNALQYLINELDESAYNLPQPLLSGNSIGKHIRHILELLEELLNGYEIEYVNYDNRKRSVLLESLPEAAIRKIKDCQCKIEAISSDKKLVLGALCGTTNSDEITLMSTLNRELIYNIEHAVHHMAILQIAIKANNLVDLPADFGLAYSTRKHQMKA